VIALRAELETFQAQAEAIRADNAAAREAAAKAAKEVAAGDQRIEAMQSEVAYAVSQIEELKAGLTSAGQAAVIARREAEQAKAAAAQAGEGSTENVTAVFREILGMAARGGGAGSGARALTPRNVQAQPEKPVREPRHGFDDVSQPLAILGLDGKFKELNPSFARLVGYQEHEFAKAAWPSPHDRQVYKQQQEEFRLLVNGELETVSVQSTYMHGQGLMVPVVGELTLVQGEDGLPSHVLLTAEDRAAHG
jgi:PAS domain S-box-containing protein